MNADRGDLRQLPSVERVVQDLGRRAPHRTLVRAARRAIDEARARIRGGERISQDAVLDRATELVELSLVGRLQPVINATGVLIHTNLGRAPLSDAQLDAVVATASGYSNLEYDLASGRRGDRFEHAAEGLREATGAEAAVVVNNNAAAVLVTLAALCEGREVIISRGELIEIGGGFRIPEVLAASGARLVEVGTTNRTHISDYASAITKDTAAILKVHPSNYRVVGFTASVAARDLARLAHEHDVPLIHDLGSGLLSTEDEPWLADDVPVAVALEDGADVATFSGDKLLGGPQAGVIVGRRDLLDNIRRHPLMRAIRPDKMTLAALEVTVNSYLGGVPGDLPLWSMARTTDGELARRAAAVVEGLSDLAERGIKVEVVVSDSVIGGGAVPGQRLPSRAVAIEVPGLGADGLDAAFRRRRPPVIGRISDDRYFLDLRSVDPDDDVLLADLIRQATTS